MTLKNAAYVVGEASPVGHFICHCRSNAISWKLVTRNNVTWSSDGTIHVQEIIHSNSWIEGHFQFSLKTNNVLKEGSLYFSFAIIYGKGCGDKSNPTQCLDTRCMCTLQMALVSCKNLNGTCIVVKESKSTMNKMFDTQSCSDKKFCKIGIPCGAAPSKQPDSAIHISLSTTTSQELRNQLTTDSTGISVSSMNLRDFSTQQTTDSTGISVSSTTLHDLNTQQTTDSTGISVSSTTVQDFSIQQTTDSTGISVSFTTLQDFSIQKTSDSTGISVSSTTLQDFSIQQTTDSTGISVSITTSPDISIQQTTDSTSISVSATISQDLRTQLTTDSKGISVSLTTSPDLSTQQRTDSTGRYVSTTTSQDLISDFTMYMTTSSTILTMSTWDQIKSEVRRDTTTGHGRHVYQDACLERYEEGVFFPETAVGLTITTNCPQNYLGTISRHCLKEKTWGSLDLNKCLRKSLGAIIDKISDPTLEINVEDVAKDINKIVFENSTLLSGDLKHAVLILTSLSQMNMTKTAFEDLMSASQGLLSASSWDDLEDRNRIFLTILDNIDEITKQIINKKLINSYIKIHPDFTTRIVSSTLPAISTEDINLDIILKDTNSSDERLGITVFKNLKTLKKNLNISLGSKVIAITASVHVTAVKITFNIEDISGTTPTCHFLESHQRNMTWTTRGCATQILNSSVLVCTCNHASIFTVIMSPFKAPKADNLLQSLTMGFLIGSSVCLCLAMVIFIILFRKLKRERAVTHLSLCGSLVIGYVLFLTGINRTDEEILCRIIAVFLHFAFLISQFAMLANGMELCNIIVFAISSKPIWKYLLTMEVVPPIIIVVATLTATKAQGYGTIDYCWLTPNYGTTWSFIGPVLAILLINAIILVFTVKKLCGLQSVSRLNTIKKLKTFLWAVCVLSPILGTSYFFGLSSLFKDVPEAHFVFIGLNGGQGLLILIFDCLCQKEIRSGLYDLYKRFKSRQLHSTKTKTEKKEKSTARNVTEETHL